MYSQYDDRPRGSGGFGLRVLIVVVIGLFSLFQYMMSAQKNPVTGEKQYVANLTPEQEIALGLESVPTMEQQYGGESSNEQAIAMVERVGNRIVQSSDARKSPYQFKFHLLADQKTVNAFALPGGQVFITEALLSKLQTEGQLAGVLGHEIGHVIDRHGAQQIAKEKLKNGLTSAAVMATYDSRRGVGGSMANAAMVQMIGQLVSLKYGRNDEIKADHFGVVLSAQAGYDPRAMIGVMKILEEVSKGSHQPEYLSSHPNPGHRVGNIEADIKKTFPRGLPPGLVP